MSATSRSASTGPNSSSRASSDSRVGSRDDRRAHQGAGVVVAVAAVDDDLRSLADRAVDRVGDAIARVGADHRRADRRPRRRRCRSGGRGRHRRAPSGPRPGAPRRRRRRRPSRRGSAGRRCRTPTASSPGSRGRGRRRPSRPSSSWRRRAPAPASLTWCRAPSRSSAVDAWPTKLIASISGWSSSPLTASWAPWTMLTTPAGISSIPSISSTIRCGVRGSRSDALEDERVAAGDRVRQEPERDHRREVERRDRGDDADRLTPHLDVDSAGDALERLALQQGGDAAGGLGRLDPAADLAARVVERLAHVLGDELRQLLAIGPERLAEGEHRAGALGDRRGGPGGLGGAGGAGGGVDVGGVESGTRARTARRSPDRRRRSSRWRRSRPTRRRCSSSGSRPPARRPAQCRLRPASAAPWRSPCVSEVSHRWYSRRSRNVVEQSWCGRCPRWSTGRRRGLPRESPIGGSGLGWGRGIEVQCLEKANIRAESQALTASEGDTGVVRLTGCRRQDPRASDPHAVSRTGTTTPSARSPSPCGRAWSPGRPRGPRGRARGRCPTA